jgi:Domain of unknown function (DUF4406)
VNVYLAGPMRGYAQFNHPAFDAAAAELRAAGHEVFSPAEHDRNTGLDTTGMQGTDQEMALVPGGLRALLAADLAWICANADAIVLLPGWQASSGATAEAAVGRALSLTVAELDEFLGASATP